MPKSPLKIFKDALAASYNNHIDELGTKENPSCMSRSSSNLTFNDAWNLIEPYKPHFVCMWREDSYFGDYDHWEFGACNIAENGYGSVFIFINVKPEDAEKIFEKYKLKKEYY